ncbi:sigma 54-interacting transcriptional regulator [Oceanobacillus alkalisoli]|uniref:sigma 54-interacting transcriptional regulator n=1 Tax=Oceanobacillus alkalisoli TaxID=2925113 RepID=UPI001F11E499|nr:sigma 54-interacting transcriptional regulator [Oceanobacillus alkalisoli]MCF3942897.1 sigma 54-interacting transcriptional regulator [Oceanobacillus alkalisoli]
MYSNFIGSSADWRLPLISDVVNSTLPFIRYDESVHNATKMLLNSNSDYLAVINQDNSPLGIITGKSILSGMLNNPEQNIQHYMITDNAHIVSQNDPILHTSSLPHSYFFVVDEVGRLTGTLTQCDLQKFFSNYVTELKQIKHSADVLNIVLDSAYEGVTVIDENAIITEFNLAYSRFIGIDKKDAIGKHVQEVIDNTNLHNTVKNGMPERGQIQYIQGQPMIVHRIPIWKDRKVVGAIGMVIFEGVSELYQIYNKFHKTVKFDQEFIQNPELSDISLGSNKTLDQLIGKSEEIHHLKRSVRKVANTNVTVLITGESGTGKEVIAQGIHHLSKQVHGPFISVNCAAIPEQLFESELFGYDDGAFTGAKKGGKPGKFELAKHGTIFLDEIAEMPLTLQIKLLRVLQEREFERIGATNKQRLQARVIAATNQDIKKMVGQGKFRKDLYYRLNIIELTIPPLRERTDDIPPLISHYLNKFSENYSMAVKQLTSDAMKAFIHYNWPGNVRELMNMMERLVILTEGDKIGSEHLPSYMIDYHAVQNNNKSPAVQLKMNEETAEKQLIKVALEQANGNKTEAAKMIGIHRTTLYQKINKYGL